MKKYALLIMLSLFAYGKPVCAQSYYTNGEIGFSAGAAQYFGDLNDNYGFRTPAPAFGMFYRKRFNFYVSVKAVFNYTSVGYDDKLSKSPFNQVRNLNFKSDIYELGLQAEFNFFKFITADRYYRCTPYLTGGIGVFYYDPYTTYKGIKFHLRDIGTEGQNLGNEELKYTHITPYFPIGAGVKYWVARGTNISLEVTDRLTTTDYLDDVSATYVGASKFPAASIRRPGQALQDRSTEIDAANPLGRPGKQRGNSSTYDQYLIVNFSVSFHFNTYHCPAFMKHDLISTY